MNRYAEVLDSLPEKRRPDALCELNVIVQLANVAETGVVQDNWRSESIPPDRKVQLQGWIYGLHNGLLNNLVTLTHTSDIRSKVQKAVEDVKTREHVVVQNYPEEIPFPNTSFPAQPPPS